MDIKDIFRAYISLHLAQSLQEGQAFYITDGAPNLGNDNV